MDIIRILLAEADQGVQTLATAFFQDHADLQLCGITGDGYETVELVHALRPQVLLLSLTLPGLDGLAVLRRLQEAPADTMPAVIVCSPFSDQRLVDYALSLGARYYLVKPVSYLDLPDTIRALTADCPDTRAEQLLLDMLRTPDESGEPRHSKGLAAAAAAAAALARPNGTSMLLKEAYFKTISTEHTDYACVEKNIRYLVGRIHRAGTDTYQSVMGTLPPCRPDNDTFLRALARKLLQG